MKYEKLLSPITIRGKEYKNRALAAPTGFFFFITDEKAPYYRMIRERQRAILLLYVPVRSQ